MHNPNLGMSGVLVDKVADWLMVKALEGAELEDIARGCCDRLAASGLPIARAQFSFSMLHPLYAAMGFTWRRDKGLQVEGIRHVVDGEVDRFIKSPYYHMFKHNLDLLRCRLETEPVFQFPVFEEFKAEGLTDYLAFITEFERDSGQGMVGSWATSRPGGFQDDEIAELLRIQKRLAVACKVAVQGSLASNMLTTYLGSNAGSRVLSGQIRRGDGETTRAAIVIADIRNSTGMAEQLGRQGYIDTLNTFFDTVAGAFSLAGAEILSFLGDGFLAIVPCERNKADSKAACQTVFGAALEANDAMSTINTERMANGDGEIRFGIGLHVGNVMFGNVGMEDRLTFSVFGSAVNEASRLEALTKKYNSPIIASQAFTDYCGSKWQELGEESLRGLEQSMKVFAPPAGQDNPYACPAKSRQKDRGQSDAENVILLHRRSPDKAKA